MPNLSAFHQFALVLMLGYFALVMILARVFSRRIATLKDFFLAGRSLTVLPVAIAFVSAWFGAGSTMGSINALHHDGISGLWYLIIPSALSCLVISLVMARHVAKQNELSQPEAVKSHYGNAGRLLLAIIILISNTNFVASQMVAAGQIFHGVFGLDILPATVFCTLVVIGYSMMGGYFAVVVTDFAQLGMVVTSLVILTLFSVGMMGAAPIIPHLPETFLSLTGTGQTPLIQYLCLTLSFVLAWSIAPEMWQRMSSTKEDKLATRAGWLGFGILGLLFAMVTTIGLNSPRWIHHSDFVMMDLAYQLPHPLLTALVLIGFIAAVTSTMDSSINVGSLTVTRDIYQGFVRPQASEKELLWVSRLSTVLVTIPAITIAVSFQDIIHILWMSADVYASAMFFPIIGILFFKSPCRLSGILAMSFGLMTVLFSTAIQYHWISVPFAWPQAPYSTLLGVAMSGLGFGLGAILPKKALSIIPDAGSC